MGVLMAIVATNYRPRGHWPVVMGAVGLLMMLAEMGGPMSLWHLLPNGLIDQNISANTGLLQMRSFEKFVWTHHEGA